MFVICYWCLICVIQQAYRYVCSSLWPLLTFFKLKIAKHIEINFVGTGKEGVAVGTKFFISIQCVSCRTISLPSFNGLCCKLAHIALFIYQQFFNTDHFSQATTLKRTFLFLSQIPFQELSHNRPLLNFLSDHNWFTATSLTYSFVFSFW